LHPGAPLRRDPPGAAHRRPAAGQRAHRHDEELRRRRRLRRGRRSVEHRAAADQRARLRDLPGLRGRGRRRLPDHHADRRRPVAGPRAEGGDRPM
ncbi:MAG: ABC transporter, permease protein (cluster 3, basic aa/glutamine/opines), partial [uncultured Thermomicrobiales bacterium]